MKERQKIRLKVFVDANILIGYFRGLKNDVNAMRYMVTFPQIQLHTSSLAIVQFLATCQRKNDHENRQLLSKTTMDILSKFTVIKCESSDIEKALKMPNQDLEDNVQYTIGNKMGCTHYVTNNKKDYDFKNITVVSAKNIRILGM